MIIQRQKYLDMLIAGQGNGLVKIITGGRRCGKSFLLFTLFHNHLVETGIDEDHIIEISFDDRRSKQLLNPDKLLDYVDEHIKDDGKTHFVILDEVQFVDDFVRVILSLMHNKQLEVYVSGSNSKFLSKDVVTEFRGRGEEIRVWPLSFKEYYDVTGGDRSLAWRNYYAYGGLPQVLLLDGEEKKVDYLRNLYELTYLKDVIEHNHLRNAEGMRQLIQVLSSCIGTSTNPKRISNTFKSKVGVTIKDSTIKDYIGYLQDAFLIEEALRYDVKGRKYIGTETKYYFSDMGLRGIVLNFRQQEETHIMENVIYNELRMRGFLVDVGMVEVWKKDNDGNKFRRNLEVDFVVNKGSQRYYIQSAFSISDENKKEQEIASLKNIDDSFKRIIIVKDDIMPYYDDNGFLITGLFDFLLNPDSFDTM
ncbi:MAG: ATP-binding protein [Bacteroidales bacterium]|nr:ATP-binding protein [Bacteroidales bacterium]